MSGARLEVHNAPAFCRKWWRDGGTGAIGATAHPLPHLLRQRAGGGMSKTATTIEQARIFDGSPEEVRNVRDFVRQTIQGCPVADDVILLASELATNAIRHTASGMGGKFFVYLHVQDGWVRTEVHDLGSDTAPSVRRSGPPGESGAGLRVVEMIADRWGFHGGRRSRVVWFEMSWQ
jgi:serine/threonine-protein kinase RsbW